MARWRLYLVLGLVGAIALLVMNEYALSAWYWLTISEDLEGRACVANAGRLPEKPIADTTGWSVRPTSGPASTLGRGSRGRCQLCSAISSRS